MIGMRVSTSGALSAVTWTASVRLPTFIVALIVNVRPTKTFDLRHFLPGEAAQLEGDLVGAWIDSQVIIS